jgi:mediator of RNA polymerase II transcription subunit 10
MKAQDSPRGSPSPPPLSGIQSETEQELLGLANALYNLGTTVIADSTKDRPKQGTDSNHTEGKPVGQRVNEVIDRLAAIEELSQKTTTMIPMQILQ